MDAYTFCLSVIALYLVYRLIKHVMLSDSDTSCDTAEAPASETELLRELHQGMARMEKRIDALETLLVERGEAERVTAGEKRP